MTFRKKAKLGFIISKHNVGIQKINSLILIIDKIVIIGV